MRKRESVEVWHKFWDSRRKDYLRDNFGAWHTLIWQVGLHYWEDLAKLATGRMTLECGCGSAQVSQYLAKRGYQTTMLDISEQALDIARRKFEQDNVKGFFIKGDMKNLGFRDNTFDIVMSFGVLEHFENVEPVISEMVRVLKPKGLFLADIITRKFSVQSIANIEIFSALFLKRLFSLRFKNIIKESWVASPFYENTIPKREYERIMRESGLTQVCITGTRPFPALALPPFMERMYARLMRSLLFFWKRFDRSGLKLTDRWGLGWYAHGIKK